MAKQSPTAKALKELRLQGWMAEVVEKRLPIPGKFVTRDLFNCIDIIAMRYGEPVLAVQVTSRTNVNARLTKSKESALVWVSTKNRFEVWGYGPNGKRLVRMTPCGWMENLEYL